MGGRDDDSETGFLFSVIEGYGPRDMLDAMLASQLGMLQGTIVRQVRLVNRTNDPAWISTSAANTLAKLVRTFTAVKATPSRDVVGGDSPQRFGRACVIRRRRPG